MAAGVTDLYYSSAWQVLEEQQAGVATAQYVWSPVYVNALVERDAHDPATSGDSLNQRLYALQDANYNVTALFDGGWHGQVRVPWPVGRDPLAMFT